MSTKAKSLGVLKYGTKITVIQYINGWWKVSYKGKIGYIPAKYTK
ncbi:hypothetical protein Q428_00190 [Fervidicella metallireducens AeB]|uniref:Uncharacterized protein n=1 Tax=Fervidicella metallireducens AeB TaxID=1403537 RepID=A0A017RZ45_9CLOT|nr:hypothetical protein Q428_00190 [Fervidicella metallireducens AeB]